jgi:hypothetical protein
MYLPRWPIPSIRGRCFFSAWLRVYLAAFVNRFTITCSTRVRSTNRGISPAAIFHRELMLTFFKRGACAADGTAHQRAGVDGLFAQLNPISRNAGDV